MARKQIGVWDLLEFTMSYREVHVVKSMSARANLNLVTYDGVK